MLDRLAEERQGHWRDLSERLPEWLRQQKRSRVLEITRLLNGHGSDVRGSYDRSKGAGLFGSRRRDQ